MRERQISLDKSFAVEYVFAVETVKKIRGITYAEGGSGTRNTLFLASRDGELLNVAEDIGSEILLTAMKFRYYEDALPKARSLLDKALKFALMEFDSEAERFSVREYLTGDELHLDAVYNFNMTSVKKSWDGYVQLINNFYSTSPTDEDKIELIRFMNSISSKRPVMKPLRYYIYRQKQADLLQRILYYNERVERFNAGEEEVAAIVRRLNDGAVLPS